MKFRYTYRTVRARWGVKLRLKTLQYIHYTYLDIVQHSTGKVGFDEVLDTIENYLGGGVIISGSPRRIGIIYVISSPAP